MGNTYHLLSGNLLKAMGPLKCPIVLSHSPRIYSSFRFCSNVLAAVWMAINSGISAFSSPWLDYQQSPPLSETRGPLSWSQWRVFFKWFTPPRFIIFQGTVPQKESSPFTD